MENAFEEYLRHCLNYKYQSKRHEQFRPISGEENALSKLRKGESCARCAPSREPVSQITTFVVGRIDTDAT